MALLALAAAALLPILAAVLRIALTGQLPAPERDEGMGAHIFQLAVVLCIPAFAVFALTADLSRPARTLLRLAPAAGCLVLAFGLLFAYEHVLLRA